MNLVEAYSWLTLAAEGGALVDNQETWLTAVQYALNTGARLDEAMNWTDKALALQENFWAHEFKAKLLQRQGKVDEEPLHFSKHRAAVNA